MLGLREDRYLVGKIKFKLSVHMVLWLSEDGWRAVVKP